MAKKKKIDTRHLFHAICHLNLIPIRSKPELNDIMVTQMLFGETCLIVEKKNKHWFKIKISADQVTGWVQTHQIQLIDEAHFEKYNNDHSYALEICHPIFNEEISKYLVLGAVLPKYDGISCNMPDGKYIYNGQAAPMSGLEYSPDLLVKIAKRYLYSPELSGGKSPFGIDAAAFIQQVYRFFGYNLPRTSQELFAQGQIVDFVEYTQVGDIVFCQNEDGNISHAGIIIGANKVIHAYGCVRIDKVDHFGIYNKELHKYTHKLRMIKRI
ncbi:MAG: C40 family peptidase [Saprospiraceae bacterium]|nr:C40 family peptidase [Saprospiraceae bacterium]